MEIESAGLKTSRSRLILTVLTIVFGAGQVFAQSAALTVAKNFTPSTVLVGGSMTTTMTVTITNPNSFTVTGISFSDAYPAGLAVDQIGAYTCGTLGSSASFNGSGWSFSNVTLAAGGSCSVPVLMHATNLGPIVNTTSQVNGTGVPAGGPASATLNAVSTIPVLSWWTLIVLAAALAAMAALKLRA
jgi:hypothetical protein